MKKLTSLLLSMLFITAVVSAQDSPKKTQKGHTNQNKFKQLKQDRLTVFGCHVNWV